jgi:hypothetical protein
MEGSPKGGNKRGVRVTRNANLRWLDGAEEGENRPVWFGLND